MINPVEDIEKILISAEELDAIITRLAKQIDEEYRHYVAEKRSAQKLIVVAIMKGSVFFYTELIKKLTVPVELDFMKVSSYGQSTISGQLKIHLDLKRDDYENIDILLVEDIVDSGKTLSALTTNLHGRGANSVRTVTLLDKPSRREVDFKADFVGAEIPDEFAVGFGLDFDEKYRDLPYIGVLKPQVYSR